MKKLIKQSFKVKFNYNIYFTKKIFDKKNKILVNSINTNNNIIKNTIIFIDKNVHKKHKKLTKEINNYFDFHNNKIKLKCNPILISGGEKSKNHNILLKIIYKLLNKYKICRHSYIIAIGGGAILDLIGYVASTAHRGINLIRIPTTVLSQNDSGIGVKNGINLLNKKNFIGNFAIPTVVINDNIFLKTLDDRSWRSGIAEALKVALIKDYDFFKFIKENTDKLNSRNMKVMDKLIYKCAYIHAKHISKNGDPFERQSSRPLDFGHWAAHKLESLTKYKILHGEAVAIGIALDSTYSYIIKYLSKNEWKEIINTIINLGFKIYIKEMEMISNNNEKTIFEGLNEFQEHLGGTLTITILKKIGLGININNIDRKVFEKSIKIIKKIQNIYAI